VTKIIQSQANGLINKCENSPTQMALANKLENEIKDQSLSSLKLFGMQLSGLDLKQINQAHLSVNIPLETGRKKLMGVNKNARIKIRKNTTAVAQLALGRNEKNQLSLKNFSLRFSKSIVIKNPVSSLLSESKFAPRSSAIKDKLVDLKIKGININEEGQVFVNGHIKALKILNASLPQKKSALKLPVFDESLLVRLGLVPARDGNAKNLLSGLGEQFNVKTFLQQLGSITKVAPYSLSISGDPTLVAFSYDNRNFHGKNTPLDLKISGTVDLESQGDLVIVVDKKPQSFSLGTYAVGAQMRLEAAAQPINLSVAADISGASDGLLIDGFSRESVKKVFPRRQTQQRVVKEVEEEVVKIPYEIGAEEVLINARLEMKASLSPGKNSITGAMIGEMIARNPYAKIENRGVKLSGQVSALLNLQEFSYQEISGLNGTKSSFSLGLSPDQKTLDQFPGLKPLSLEYGLKMRADNKATIKVPELGAVRFVRPVKNMEGDQKLVDTIHTRENFHPIGSENYFKQLNKITGSEVRDASEVKILIDGISSMPERLELMEHAKEYICFQTFEFSDDDSGWRFAKALVEARERGVKVFGIIDSLGNIKSLNSLEKENPIYEYLSTHGVSLKIYNNGFEEGIRKIFAVAKRYPTVFAQCEKKLHNISDLLDHFQKIGSVVVDPKSPIEPRDRLELAHAIHRLFGGKAEISPQDSVNELNQILANPLIDLRELLLALKRLGDISYRSHEKYLIVDGVEAIVGGMNIADEYLKGGSGEQVMIDGNYRTAFRDSDVKLKGDVVRDAYRSFRRNWLFLAAERLPFSAKINPQAQHGVKVSMLQNRPWEDGEHKLVNFLLYNLRTLKRGEKAWFETAYFLPTGVLRPLQKELVKAAERGVDVRILTNSEKSTDFKPLVEAAVFDYRQLLKAGIRLFARTDDRMVHAKVALFGEELTTIGSCNLDNRSAAHDTEDICAIYDQNINQQMTSQLLIDMFEQSKEIHLADIKALPLGAEIKAAGMRLLGELL
jgi:phosphatidylserine/phosphatidylglycerophosphate/cardiolipin synthase-like enzyme